MLGVGTYEFLVILVVAVLVLGPEHLPKVLRTMQKIMGTVRQVTTEFQRTMNLEETLSGTRYDKTAKKTVKKKKKPAVPPAAPAPNTSPDSAASASPTEAPAPAQAAPAQASSVSAAPPAHAGQTSSASPQATTPPVQANDAGENV